ncbi:MAG: hypothetical protein ACYC0V_01575 [Armatimonadota bacterium]
MLEDSWVWTLESFEQVDYWQAMAGGDKEFGILNNVSPSVWPSMQGITGNSQSKGGCASSSQACTCPPGLRLLTHTGKGDHSGVAVK